MNDKAKINKVFKNLRKQGYFVRQSFWCCQTCGCAAVPPDHENRYVFYHKQDREVLDKNGNITMKFGGVLNLAWAGSGSQISQAIKDEGLRVRWSGTEDKRIGIVGQEMPDDVYLKLCNRSNERCI